MSKQEDKMKRWTESEQNKCMMGFVLGVVFTGVTMSIAFYNGFGT